MLQYQMLERLRGLIVAVTHRKFYILHLGDVLYTEPLFSENAVIQACDG